MSQYFSQVGTLEDIHIARSRFIRVMNGFLQHPPRLSPPNLIRNVSAHIAQTSRHLDERFNHRLNTGENGTLEGTVPGRTEDLGQSSLEGLNDQFVSSPVSRSSNKVVQLASLFMDCLITLFNLMDLEWKDVVSFDENLKTIPIGHGNLRQFIAFATFDSQALEPNPLG